MFSNTAMSGLRGHKAFGDPGDYRSRATKTGKTRDDISMQYKALGIDLTDTAISRPWTPDGEEVMLELWDGGYKVKDICKELNRTIPDVLSRLAKVGYERLSPKELEAYGEIMRGGI